MVVVEDFGAKQAVDDIDSCKDVISYFLGEQVNVETLSNDARRDISLHESINQIQLRGCHILMFSIFESYFKGLIDRYCLLADSNNWTLNKLLDPGLIYSYAHSHTRFNAFLKDRVKPGKEESNAKNLAALILEPINHGRLIKALNFTSFVKKESESSNLRIVCKEIFGTEDFLKKNVSIKIPSLDVTTRSFENAEDFIDFYVREIRNEIAHSNQPLNLQMEDFNSYADAFISVIKAMEIAFEENLRKRQLHLQNVNLVDLG